jgi:hypothetical protein
MWGAGIKADYQRTPAMSGIKIFTEMDKESGGFDYPSIHRALDKCDETICAKFDEWRKDKKIISAVPERYIGPRQGTESWCRLTVLYELKE